MALAVFTQWDSQRMGQEASGLLGGLLSFCPQLALRGNLTVSKQGQ